MSKGEYQEVWMWISVEILEKKHQGNTLKVNIRGKHQKGYQGRLLWNVNIFGNHWIWTSGEITLNVSICGNHWIWTSGEITLDVNICGNHRIGISGGNYSDS
jgi:hypothetical protein